MNGRTGAPASLFLIEGDERDPTWPAFAGFVGTLPRISCARRTTAGPKGWPSRSSPKASEGWRREWIHRKLFALDFEGLPDFAN